MGGHGPGRSGLGGDLAELARSDRSAAESAGADAGTILEVALGAPVAGPG